MKILIVGIGGVGGYFGGLLAKHKSNENKIYFMARGEHLQQIKTSGLTIVSQHQKWIVYPDIASDNPEDFGLVEYAIICTKSYDLKETAQKIKSCIKDGTVIIPLLNGLDSSTLLRNLFPNALVADGCAFTISRLVSPGKIEVKGNSHKIIYGIQGTVDVRLNHLSELFHKAGIDCKLTEEINIQVWQKFIFIAAIATITSYYLLSFGEIKANQTYISEFADLINECISLALKMGILLEPDFSDIVWNRFLLLQPQSTSSMCADFMARREKTEIHSLSGFVVKKAQEYKLEVPQFKRMYEGILVRN